MKPQVEQLEDRNLLSWPNQVFLMDTPQDIYFPDQWALNNPGGYDINAIEGWDIVPSNEIVVAVIDTGINLDHPDFIDRIWTNSGEIPGDNIDNDNNGYKDDVNGWDFSHDEFTNMPGDSDVTDTNGHGTMVSGVIAANHNTIGIAGINPIVKIMPLKIFNIHTIAINQWANKALRYAANNGASIINCSWGTSQWTQNMKDAVVHAKNKDVLIVAAAGNNPTIDIYPASFSGPGNVISVGAVDQDGVVANFSHSGMLYAPGVEIISTYKNGDYHTSSGTSFAAPHVAAVASLTYSGDFNQTIQDLINSSDGLKLDMFEFLN